MPGLQIPNNITESEVVKILLDILSEPTRRQKLPNINTFNDAIELIKKSRRIIILTGAGVRTTIDYSQEKLCHQKECLML